MQLVDNKTAAELERRLLSEQARALRERQPSALDAAQQALARLADGSYGACQQCGAAITVPRLLAQPSAAHCLACQQGIEGRYRVDHQ